MNDMPQPPPQSRLHPFLTSPFFRILIVLLVIGISVAIFAFRDSFAQLAAVGYVGIFLVSLLGNATIILPAPSLALVFAMGAVLPPVYVGLAAGIGEALGELTGYAAGYAGRAVIEDRAAYARMKMWMERRGDLSIFFLSVFPNPFFDLAGIAAGSMGIPVWRFLIFCWAGKTIKTMAVALAGARSLIYIERFLQ